MTAKTFENILKDTNFWIWFKGDVNDIFKQWTLPHRHFHTPDIHLQKILNRIEQDKDKYSKLEYDIMRIVAIYHDVIYLSATKDSINIEKSIKYFEKDFPNMMFIYKDKIIDIIDSTGDHNFESGDKLSRNFNFYDMYDLLHNKGEDLILSNNLVAQEHKTMDFNIFKNNNIKFLTKYLSYNSELQKVIDYMNLRTSF